MPRATGAWSPALPTAQQTPLPPHVGCHRASPAPLRSLPRSPVSSQPAADLQPSACLVLQSPALPAASCETRTKFQMSPAPSEHCRASGRIAPSRRDSAARRGAETPAPVPRCPGSTEQMGAPSASPSRPNASLRRVQASRRSHSCEQTFNTKSENKDTENTHRADTQNPINPICPVQPALGDPQRALPTPAMLGFWDSVIKMFGSVPFEASRTYLRVGLFSPKGEQFTN